MEKRDDFIIKKVVFDRIEGYMVLQLKEGGVVCEQFIPEVYCEDFMKNLYNGL